MKTTSFTLSVLLSLVACSAAVAAPVALHTGDRLMKMSDRVVIVRNGSAIPLTSEVTLTDGSRVSVAGSLISKTGARRALRDCETIGPDGRRLEDNTSCIVIIDGQVMIMKGGVTRRLEMAANLGGGRTVTQDGVLMDRGGSKTELKEGQIVALNGQVSGSGFEQVRRNIGSAR